MSKICLVYSFNPSVWVSCQKIVSNLLKSYQLLPGVELVHVHYGRRMTDDAFWNASRQIVDARPTHVVFMDHSPHPLNLINVVSKRFEEHGHKPHFVFHLYGDFTLTFAHWKKLENLLAGHLVTWYAASDRQKNMLSEFIPAEQLQVCPFPVDPEEFHPDQALRKKFRAENNWPNDERVFLFTGRLSRQKRIHQMLATFIKWQRLSKARARLVFVGEVDKLGEPFLQRGEWEGEYFHFLHEAWEALPPQERSQIEFHGFRPNQELQAYYNAADCLVNISVHNDEDYGMSCAEALACGLPLILTDWAGFSSFRRPGLEELVKMVPVKISPKGKLIHLSSLERAFEETFHNPLPDRHFIAQTSLTHTGVAAVAQVVKQGLKLGQLFTQFKPALHQAAQLESYQGWATFTDLKKRCLNDFYLKVYRHYVE